MPRSSRATLAVAAALTLTACSGGESVPAGPATTTASAAASSASVGSATTTSSVGSASVPAGRGLLVLEPDGVGLATGTSIRHLPFGSDLATVTSALTRTVGPVTKTPQPECGQGARVQVSGQGFSALFDGTRFVGWLDSGRSQPRLTTASGIGVGSTLAQVRSSFAGVTVTTDTLGPEWTFEGNTLGGLLDGTTATSRMTDFFAGETCFFR